MWKYFGTIANAILVVLGGAIGVVLAKHKKPNADGQGELSQAIMVCMGLCTLFASISGLTGVKSGIQAIVVVVSMAVGVLIGTLLHVADHINRLGDRLIKGDGKHQNPAAGMVMATLIFCIGSMAILGSFEGAMNPNDHLELSCHTTILIKSVMDFSIAICLAATYGGSVMLSAVPLFIYQGSLTLLASIIQPFLIRINALPVICCVGSLILILIALNLMNVKQTKTADFLPALALPIIICAAASALGMPIQ